MKQITSEFYNIYFDNTLQSLTDFLALNTYSKIFIVTDENTGKYCLPVLQSKLPQLDTYNIIEIPYGEENKNIDYCIAIWRMLLDFEADRKALVINLGGGVVTDMGSFAASTFKRGIDFIQIPTTLLSQVDASVGGKTGIDMNAVKNIIGTFVQPKAVIISSDFLKTLPLREITSGFAEMLKHGIIADKAYFERLQQIDTVDNVSNDLVFTSVEIKNKVVSTDPYENGLRKILNYGHTIGHAIESWSLNNEKHSLLHGEAIAIGMVCEAYLASKLVKLSNHDLQIICHTFIKFYGKYSLKTGTEQALLSTMRNDKKNNAGNINFSLPDKIGNCLYDIPVTETDIVESLDFYRTL
ncbi:MAG: 3-dehydroquinate synthase [Sphingobacteriales bacterium]|jgi:3-dehydroquinate synthase|nr:MAG: 3-dehydroquinate synthase [Sphingobacteriales bacterium]